jgi:serine/threonine-protein kinase
MEARQAGVGDAAEVQPPSVSDSVTDVGEPAIMAAPPVDIDRGAVLAGRYQVEAIIGRGGSGVVLRAFDRVAKTPIAIKILKGDLARDPHWLERFSRELRLARQIQHPNVCRVFDIAEADGHRFLTMELAESGTLREALQPERPLRPLADRLADVRALISGLGAIHAAGIVHRDIKPDNLLRMSDGRLVLSDFGLATNPSEAPIMTVMVGTPTYMAPEVVMGDPATPQSDVWALGIVIYELLFGRRPEWQNTRSGRTMKLPGSKRAETQVENALARLCQRCLAENPLDRPSDAREVARLLARTNRFPAWMAIRGAGRPFRRWALLAAAAAALAVGTQWIHFWAPAVASSDRGLASRKTVFLPEPGASVPNLTEGAKLLASLPGQVHCFSAYPNRKQALVIWGEPRRAEILEVASGARRPAPLSESTYAEDCPQVAPDGSGILFTRTDAGNPTEIMFSRSLSGEPAKKLTKGTDPVWRPGHDEFVFTIDDSHAALFSMATMDFTIIENGVRHGRLVEKSISPGGDALLLRYMESADKSTVVTESVPDFAPLHEWSMPRSTREASFWFDESSLLFTQIGSADLVALDLSSGKTRRLGAVPNRVVRALQRIDASSFVLQTRLVQYDAFLFDGTHAPRALTKDGATYWVAANQRNDILAQKMLPDGSAAIFLYRGGAGPAVQVTKGPFDSNPAFSSSETDWFYVDYTQQAIVHCASLEGGCAPLYRDEHGPTWPVPSPDGQYLAFTTILGGARLHLRAASGGTVRDLGATALECPPIWTDAHSLWVYRGVGTKREWAEIDVRTGEKTGRVQLTKGFSPRTCEWGDPPVDSPFFRPARVLVSESSNLWLARDEAEVAQR